MNAYAVDEPMEMRFGPFQLSPAARLLTRDGVPVDIGGRSFDLLTALVERPGRVLPKRELLDRVWPDVTVEDGSLRFHMAGLRKTLGDGEGGDRYIATQVGVGYAFVAPVERVARAARPGGEAGLIGDEEGGGTGAQLPPRPGRLFGRSADINLLEQRVGTTPLFSIVGPPGVGKTSLATEIAHDLRGTFEGGAAFVDLAMIEDPSLVASAIAGALGIPVQVDDPMPVISAHLRDAQTLIVLDNCEHVINSVSAIVDRLGAAAPRLRILATSREPLRTANEHVHWLGALAFPESSEGLGLEELLTFPAVQLFVERAKAADSTLAIDPAAARMIGDMCRQLDGMALPIELAAVRVASHGTAATAALIGERFSLGWTGRRTARPRHQTLQAALDWSYDLLSDQERRVFERLAVFIGPFDLEAALAVVSDEDLDARTVASMLDALAAKSLLAPNRGDGPTYRLLEMTRAYAREKLAERGGDESQAAHRRHASHYLARLEAASSDVGALVARGTGRLGNIRSALEFSFGAMGEPGVGIRLAAASAPAFLHLSLLVECRSWCARAIAALDAPVRGSGIELELQAALGLALMFTRGNGEAAEAALRRALAVATDLEDRWSQLRLLGRLHIFHERIGDFAAAKAWAEMAVGVAADIDHPEATAVAASLAGISHHLAGNHREARASFEKSLALGLPSERARTIRYGFDHRNRSRIGLARTLWLLGWADQADLHAKRAISDAAVLDHAATYCIALVWALSVFEWRGDDAQAEETLDAFAHCAEINAFGPYITATAGLRAARDVWRPGRAADALGRIEESLARLHGARYELLTTSFELSLAQGYRMCGRKPEAQQLLASAIERCRANGEMLSLAELMRMQAKVVEASEGGREQAEALLREALAVAAEQGALALELRAATDLASLLGEIERGGEGLALLAATRGRFGEGAGTADLEAADIVIERLSPAPD